MDYILIVPQGFWYSPSRQVDEKLKIAGLCWGRFPEIDQTLSEWEGAQDAGHTSLLKWVGRKNWRLSGLSAGATVVPETSVSCLKDLHYTGPCRQMMGRWGCCSHTSTRCCAAQVNSQRCLTQMQNMKMAKIENRPTTIILREESDKNQPKKRS